MREVEYEEEQDITSRVQRLFSEKYKTDGNRVEYVYKGVLRDTDDYPHNDSCHFIMHDEIFGQSQAETPREVISFLGLSEAQLLELRADIEQLIDDQLWEEYDNGVACLNEFRLYMLKLCFDELDTAL